MFFFFCFGWIFKINWSGFFLFIILLCLLWHSLRFFDEIRWDYIIIQVFNVRVSEIFLFIVIYNINCSLSLSNINTTIFLNKKKMRKIGLQVTLLTRNSLKVYNRAQVQQSPGQRVHCLIGGETKNEVETELGW